MGRQEHRFEKNSGCIQRIFTITFQVRNLHYAGRLLIPYLLHLFFLKEDIFFIWQWYILPQGRAVELRREMPHGDRANLQPDIPYWVPWEDGNPGAGPEADENSRDIPQHQHTDWLPKRWPSISVPKMVRYRGGTDSSGEKAGLQPLVLAWRARYVEWTTVCFAAPGRQRFHKDYLRIIFFAWIWLAADDSVLQLFFRQGIPVLRL